VKTGKSGTIAKPVRQGSFPGSAAKGLATALCDLGARLGDPAFPTRAATISRAADIIATLPAV
jgi:hypothetical protein